MFKAEVAVALLTRHQYQPEKHLPRHKNIGRSIVALLALAFWTGWGCFYPVGALNGDQANLSLQRATRLNEQGHNLDARRILQGLIRDNFTDKRVYAELGRTYTDPFDASSADLRVGESYINKSLEMDPQFGIAYRELCQSALHRDDFAGAVKMANKALSVKEPDRSAIYHRGKAYVALKDYPRALADIDAWLNTMTPAERASERTRTGDLFTKANLLEKMKRNDDAIAVYRQILPYRVDMIEFSIVRCLTNEKRFDEGIAEISKLIKQNPQDDEAFHIRATLKLKTNDLKGALADCNQAIALSPLSSYYRDRAAVYEALGQPDLAKKDIEK